VPVPGSELLNTVPIAKGVLESDVIVSLPKLKTHGFQKYTGCVKNQFGCIPGLTKASYHVTFPDANVFARMLLEVNRIVSPSLYIMDGINSMQGNGPRGGTPLNTGLLLFSTDPIALDATVCRLIELDPEFVPTIKYSEEQKDGVWDEEQISVVGDPMKRFYASSFDVDRMPIRPYRSAGPLRLAANMLVPKPTIDPEKCIRCGICVEACPADPKALNWESESRDDPPVYTYRNCIRCYCCQEMCPESAIYLRKTVVRRITDLFSKNR
jgi:NAD-dependent dihydropyrimidine dehydrogenase PreA subunit